MNSPSREPELRSILLLISSLGGIVLTISAAIVLLILKTINHSALQEAASSPLAATLTASALIALGLLLGPVAWLSLKRLQGWKLEGFSLPPLRPWTWIVLPGLWFLVITLATLFHSAPGASVFAPFLHFFSVALPIYLVIRVCVNRIPLGSSQRAWGVFGSGMTLSPLLAVIAEGTIIVFGLLVFGAYLGFNPDKMFDFERLVNQIEGAPDLESLVFLVGPLLKNPLTLLIALTLLSGFVPIIEEIVKSIGVWLVVDRLSTPAQGFALGILSGAGFALSESLFASTAADDTWALTLTARAISSTMHMLAAGLVGWGIASARLEKRYLRLFGLTSLAMLLHSVWNAGAVFTVAGSVGVMISIPDVDFFSSIMILAGLGLLFILTSGMIVALFALNMRLREVK